MLHQRLWQITFAVALLVAAIAIAPRAMVRGADTQEQQDAKQKARDHWENVVEYSMDEATSEWSLVIYDKDIHDRGWFEFLELWRFKPDEKRWEQLKAEKFAKAIVLPKQKTSDEPQDCEMLKDLKEIEPKTGGLWYAKWKIDDVECSTPIRIGTAHALNKIDGPVPDGMLKMVVPIDLNKSEKMLVPDPRLYCISGGPGKPDSKDAKKK